MAIKNCRECGKDVSSNAEKCPHCGAPPMWTRVASALSFGNIFWLTVFGLIIYLTVDYDDREAKQLIARQASPPSRSGTNHSTTISGAFMEGFNKGFRGEEAGASVTSYNEALSSLPQVVEPESPPLELQSFRCEKLRDYAYVRGEVKNVSRSKLENVLAVGTFRTKSGELVKSENMLIDYRPLMPGQTSPFKVMAEDSSEISKCQIGFSLFSGESLPYAEKKKGK